MDRPTYAIILLLLALAVMFLHRGGLSESAATTTPSTASLKERALALSAELLSFYERRNAIAPHATDWIGKHEAWGKASSEHMRETMAYYTQRFSALVIAMHDDLALHGWRDQELEAYYAHPTNPLGVKAIGEYLGALAHRIPSTP